MSEEIKERLEADAATQAEILAKLPKGKPAAWLRKETTKRGKLAREALALITSLDAELTAARAEVARKDEALDGLVKWFSDPPQRMDDWGVGYFLPKSVEPDVQAALAALTPAEEGERG